MSQQRDAILGYAQELKAYYIQFIENNIVLETCYGLMCPNHNDEQADRLMTTLLLKKSFWLNGSSFQDSIKGLQPLALNLSYAC